MRHPRLLPVVATACVVAIAVAPAASAQRITLGWVETTSPSFGYPAMTFKVEYVVLTAKAWAVRATVVNRSARVIRITAPEVDCVMNALTRRCDPQGPPVFGFGLLPGPDLSRTYAKPKIPPLLRPGKSWTGTFGGPGKLRRGTLTSVTFGYFRTQGVSKRAFSWTSQHSFRP